MASFNNIGGISSCQSLSHTFFRFPLRSKPSKLSEEIYCIDRLHNLLEAFQEEGKYLLLFLRSVQSIEVIELTEKGQQNVLFQVSISAQDDFKRPGQIRGFFNEIEHTFGAHIHPSVTQNITSFTAVVKRGSKCNTHQWVVAHQVGSNNPVVIQLAEKQNVLPWVGIAFEISRNFNHQGRIFCFLPLPSEERSPLPVHVNGTFAVTCNRRSVKWVAQERQDDEEARWNSALLESCLPSCYRDMILHLIHLQSVDPNVVYNCWPSVSKLIDSPWQRMLAPLFDDLFTRDVIYTQANGGSWISLREAVFVPSAEKLLHDTLLMMNFKVVQVPLVIEEAIKFKQVKINSVSPKILRNVFKKNTALLEKVEFHCKVGILKYCLMDYQYQAMEGIKLIPLKNGEFDYFRKAEQVNPNEVIFLCSSEVPYTLLPNLKHRLVDVSNDRQLKEVEHSLAALARSKTTQLHLLTDAAVSKLLDASNTEKWSQKQMEDFWTWLQSRDLDFFSNSKIVPVNGDQKLTYLQKTRTVYISKNSNCPPVLASTLQKLGLLLADQNNYHFLKHDQLSTHLYCLSTAGILDALVHVVSSLKTVCLSQLEAQAIQDYLVLQPQHIAERISVLHQLPIFITLQQTDPRCIQESNVLVEKETYGLGSLIASRPYVLSNENNNKVLLELVVESGMVRSVGKIDYICQVLLPMVQNNTYSSTSIDCLMEVVLKLINLLDEASQKQLITVVENVTFLNTSTNTTRCNRACDLYDCSDDKLLQLFAGVPVFPIHPFNSSKYLEALRMCGLKRSESLIAQDIIQVIESIMVTSIHTEIPVRCSRNNYIRACAVVNFLNESKNKIFLNHKVQLKGKTMSFLQALVLLAKNSSWLPVCSVPPFQYFHGKITWKAAQYIQCIASTTADVMALSQSLNESVLPFIAGSTLLFVRGALPPELVDKLGIPASKLVVHIVEHLQCVANHKETLDLKLVGKTAMKTYDYISRVFKTSQVVPKFTFDNWVWLEEHSVFVSPKNVAFNPHNHFQHTLEPFVYVLPRRFSVYKQLFKACGIGTCITDDQIFSVLTELQCNPHNLPGGSVAYMNLVMNILQWIVEYKPNVTSHAVLVPTDMKALYPMLKCVNEVVYTDNKYLRDVSLPSDKPCILVHPRVTSEMAVELGITPLSAHLGLSQDVMVDAGQHEPLLQRLRNILKQYQDVDGFTIFKEMLQNADDANATEVNILYDARLHSTAGLFFPKMATAHGPALVIHNNSQFTKTDFKSITKLAGATKENQPFKIGKFGVGFCSVYHITDVPSFVSQNLLYIFDPTLSYLKEAVDDKSQPGKKLMYTHKILQPQLAPFEDLFSFSSSKPYNGTIFRLPFRTTSSKLSGKCHDPDEYFKMLSHKLQESGSELLLFLNNVNKITLSFINNRLSKPTLVHTIKRSIPQKLQDNVFYLRVQCQSVIKLWIVSSYQTSNDKQEPQLASVACCLKQNESSEHQVIPIQGEAFCFLPLGSINTGLPVHVSANFAVMSNRRGIWASDSTSDMAEKEVLWNRQLMKNVIPVAYHNLLVSLKNFCARHSQINLTGYVFYLLWPLKERLRIKNPWEAMIQQLYSHIANEQLFFSCCTNEWLSLNSSEFLVENLFSTRDITPACIMEALEIINEPIIELPKIYHCHLERMQFIQCEDFLNLFFEAISQFESQLYIRNEVLFYILKSYALYVDIPEYKRNSDIIYRVLKSHPCIPCTPDGTLLRLCEDVIDTNASISELFEAEDGLFPISEFINNEPCKRAMIKLGLKQSQLPCHLLIECANTIPSLYATNQEKALIRISLILHCLKEYGAKNIEEIPEAKPLCTIPFLPVLSMPKDYILHWKGIGQELLPPNDLIYSKERDNITILVGSQAPILDVSCLHSFDINTVYLLGVAKTPNVQMVVNQLYSLIDKYNELQLSTSDQNSQFRNSITRMYHAICQFLDKSLEKEGDKVEYSVPQRGSHIVKLEFGTQPLAQISHPQSSIACNEQASEVVSRLKRLPCVWCENQFIQPKFVAKEWKTNGPILYPVPSVLSSRRHLQIALGCKKTFGINDLLGALEQLHKLFNHTPISDQYHNLLREILPELDKFREEEFKDIPVNVFLPDVNFIMYPATDIVYMDVEWCDVPSNIHPCSALVTQSLAKKLKIEFVRSRVLKKYEGKFGGTTFGQHEELTRRIGNILRDYRFDMTLLKELMQNADDANATQICIILDKRFHNSKEVFSDKWKDLQGPALLVWNDSEFSENDLIGIQKLGLGGKREDADTIGQFGIGFNAVYHITDCPSFITGGKTLCILDPHCRYAPEADELHPGRRYNNVDRDFWNRFADIRPTYAIHEIDGCPFKESMKHGTVFRFPLRHNCQLVNESKIVKVVNEGISIREKVKPISAATMHKHLLSWSEEIKLTPLFLSHLKQISFYVIENPFRPKMEMIKQYTVQLSDSALADRVQFQTICKSFNQQEGCLPHRVQYMLSIQEENEKTSNKWLVQQSIGDEQKPTQRWIYVPQIKPQHAIAVCLTPKPKLSHDFLGQLFCFLPLPITTHFPVHINGQFILNSTRREVWTSSDTEKPDNHSVWNDNIFEAISSSYTTFLESVSNYILTQDYYTDQKQLLDKLNHYYSLFPISRIIDGQNIPYGRWECLAKEIFKKLLSKNCRILVSVKCVRSVYGVQWSALRDIANPAEQSYFFPLAIEESSQYQLSDVLKAIGMNLNEAPYTIYSAFESIDCQLPSISKQSVYCFCRDFQHKIGSLPCSLSQTTLKNIDNLLIILRFILSKSQSKDYFDSLIFPENTDELFLNSPWNSPFLLTADNQLRKYEKDVKIICSKFSELFPKCANIFLHPKLVELNIMPVYFCLPTEDEKDFILSVFDNTLPHRLKVGDTESVDNYPSIIPKSLLTDIWICLHNEKVFSCHMLSILTTWALIPTQQHELFALPISEGSSFLPFVCDDNNFSVVSDILIALGMPSLDIEICLNSLEQCPNSLEQCPNSLEQCPKISDQAKILSNLVQLNKRTNIEDYLVVNPQKMTILLEYLEKINFKESIESVHDIISLPVFLTIQGHLTPLTDMSAFIYPKNVPTAGISVWLPQFESLVFLDSQGQWKKLGEKKQLGIQSIKPEVLYTDYIFKHFKHFSFQERKQHLTYFKDGFLDQHMTRKEHGSSENEKASSNKFYKALCNLPIIGDGSNSLRRAKDFTDHTKSIFTKFKEHFLFLPSCYRDTKQQSCYRDAKQPSCNRDTKQNWLDFFKKIGLQQEVYEDKYIELCNIVAGGKHADIHSGSSELLQYLLSSLRVPSIGHFNTGGLPSFISNISKISFIVAESLPELSCVAKPVDTGHAICDGEKYCSMTKINGAAISNLASLIWTCRPVISIPQTFIGTRGVDYFQRFGNFRLTVSVDDIVSNVLTISQTSFSSFDLFDSYNLKVPTDPSLLEIMQKSFEMLSENLKGDNEGHHAKFIHSKLSNAKCIPVQADLVEKSNKFVLVEPQYVIVEQNVSELKPFLHQLPLKLKASLPSLFMNILGLKNNITFKHCSLVLREIHNCSIGEELDPNTQTKVKVVIQNLYNLFQISMPSAIDLQPLYLPNIRGCLTLSTSLYFNDEQRYDKCIYSRSSVPILQLPTVLNSQGDSVPCIENVFCKLLPKQVKPLSLSSNCSEALEPHCVPISDPTPYVTSLCTALRVPTTPSALRAILKHNDISQDDTNKIVNYFETKIRYSEIKAIDNLKICLFLAGHRGSIVGSCKVHHFIEEKNEGLCTVYVDSSVDTISGDFSVGMPMAKSIVKKALPEHCPSKLNDLIPVISMLLRAQHDLHIKAILEHVQVSSHNLAIESNMQIVRLIPVLGHPVPNNWCHRLDQNMHNIFSLNEWVAYEREKGQFIYARIAHPVLDDFGNIPENVYERQYGIYYADNQEVVIVKVLKLYKFLRSNRRSKQVVPYEGNLQQTSPDRFNDSDFEKVKTEILEQLRKIECLSDNQEIKIAIKRLQKKWHPDKNPDCLELAGEVFKFIMNQNIVKRFKEISYEIEIEIKEEKQWKRESADQESDIPCPEVVINVDEGRRWLRQAKIDKEAVLVMFESVKNDCYYLSGHVCFLANQVVEKALKAGMYAICGEPDLTKHYLVPMASNLRLKNPSIIPHDFVNQSKVMEKYYINTRYPNTCPKTLIPADMYTLEDAGIAVQIAKYILDVIDKLFTTP